jgi:hypothetical protein
MYSVVNTRSRSFERNRERVTTMFLLAMYEKVYGKELASGTVRFAFEVRSLDHRLNILEPARKSNLLF